MSRIAHGLFRARTLLSLLAMAGALATAGAQPQVLWQIGRFDDSSQEFRSQGIDYTSPSSDVVYTIGVSHDSDWIRFQPGPANAQTGGRLHPFTVRFKLDQPPQGLYQLRIAILYETPRLSALRLSINGHQGLFYFHPRLDFAAGDWEGTFVPQTSRDEKLIDIPARWLARGQNTLVFTAVDDPAAPQSSQGDIAPGQSGLVYDAISLAQDAQAAYPRGAVSLLAVPTIFYRQTPNGLDEVVDIFASLHDGARTRGQVKLSVSGHVFTQPLALDGQFGEQRLRFAVPEWQGNVAGSATVDGRRFPLELTAAKKWTLDIVAQEHLDVGFTDYRAKVAELQSESVDGVLDIERTHPEFRWSLDGAWIAQQYLASRSPARQQELLDAIRKGGIVLPPQFANQHTGVASLEDLIRSLYPAHRLAQENHLPVGAANITDVPSYSWSYASILHDAGIRYFAAGSNSWRAPVMLIGRWNEKSPFYWEGPDGGRVMMWYSRAYLQLASMFGTPPTLPAVEDATPVFLQAYTRPDYRASSVIIFGSQLENTPLDQAQVELPREWAQHYAWPCMVFTTFKDAMASIEEQFRSDLPVYRGDFGPYWEDGFASDARHTALHRRNEQEIMTAEKMAVVPALLKTDLRPDGTKLAEAWHNMLLFDEHTWTAASATTQPEGDQNRIQLHQKQLEPVIAQNDIAQSIEHSWAQLESILSPRQDSIAVFNSLSWPRDGWVDVDLPAGRMLVDPATHAPVKQVILRREAGTELPGFGGATNRVRFLADRVPAVGYKLFAIAPDSDASTFEPHRDSSAEQSKVLENRYYRITLDPERGAIRSIFDKQLLRELVDSASPYRFGAYVYVQGADDMPGNSLYRYGAAQHLPELHPAAASNGRLVSITTSAQGTTAVLESRAPNTPLIRTTVVLAADEKRIDLRYRLHKDATLKKEAAYIAFPLAAQHPEFRYETQNGWVDPARDELAGGSREWYTVNHWAAMSDGSATMAIIPRDAPLVCFGDIVRGKWPAAFEPHSGAILSWIMSNYWDTNFASSQGGDFEFNYTFVSAPAFNADALTRMGWQTMTPLESDPVHASASTNTLPRDAASFLSIDGPGVVLTAWKLAEDGDGSILRLEDISDHADSVHITSRFLHITDAWRTNVLEDNETRMPAGPQGIEVNVPAFGIVTVRIHTRPAGGHS
ncbi:MAG TPA: polysaccharide lyase family protein [Terracidiphilus sp.]|nr:polysaccharide lyase family protein [Terracidiphilus sp.]